MITFETHADPAQYASRFGGLWSDLSSAKEHLKGRLELGLISEKEASLLDFWIDNGYVILRGAVDPVMIDRSRQDIDASYSDGTGLVETYEFGDVRVARAEQRHATMPHKLLDSFAASASTRNVMFSDDIVRFMNMIFERPALAFQSLYFQTGSQQPIHQDTAYVRVSRPMELAATWIAYEDIQPGSGELEYMVGSHRIPEFLFDGHSKWLAENSKENPAFLEHILRECQNKGLRKERFLPKKGDVLIWSADLGHGGSPVTKPTSRRSLVTHWCPTSVTPMYYNYPPHSGQIRVSPKASYSFSFHGYQKNPHEIL